MTLVAIAYLAKLHGVSTSTIRRWEAQGKIPQLQRTFGGHRRFEVADSDGNGSCSKIGYARVSSYDQKEDLERQVERVKQAGCTEVLGDIGSSLNCKKPGLRSLLRKLLSGSVSTLVVTHEDRLLRFGVELIRYLCRHVKTDIKVLLTVQPKTFEEELAKDVITLMTVFCARLYGKRSHRTSKIGTGSKTDLDEKKGVRIKSAPLLIRR